MTARQIDRPRLGADAIGPLAAALVALAVGVFGLHWDVSWHRTIGRDTFWSSPHLFLYAAVMLQGLTALWATAWTTSGQRRLPGPELRLLGLRAPVGYALLGIGALVVIGSAPFDDLWHRLNGRDVDIW